MKRLWMVLALMLVLIMDGMALAEEPALDSDMGSFEIILPDDSEPTPAPAPQDLSHLMLGQTYLLPGYAKIKPVSFAYVDSIAQYTEAADLTMKKWIAFDSNTVDWNIGGKDDYKKTRMRDVVLLIGGETSLEPKDWSDTGLSAYLLQNKPTTYIPDCWWTESGVNSDFACIDFQVINMQNKAIDLTKTTEVIVNFAEAQFKGWIRKVNEDIGQVYRFYVNVYTPHYGYAVVSPKDAAPITTGQVATYVVGATLPNIIIEDDAPLSITIIIDGNELTYHIR